VAFICLPFFEVRAITALAWLLLAVSGAGVIARRRVFLGLFFFFNLCFLYSPYYNVPDQYPAKIIFLAGLFIFAFIWAKSASGELRLDFSLPEKGRLLLLALLLYLISFWALRADIPWKGDEDYFITMVADLARYCNALAAATPAWAASRPITLSTLTVLGCILVFILARIIKKSAGFGRPGRLWIAGAGLIIFSLLISSNLVLSWSQAIGPPSGNLRYPFITSWLNLFCVYPDIFGDIALYRTVPFLSCVLISWLVYGRLRRFMADKTLALLFSLAFSTVPLMYFYSSLLYIEMPVVLLMSACLFDSERLLTAPLERLKTMPAWYAILAIAFFKETVAIFLLVAAGFRLAAAARNKGQGPNRLKTLTEEIGIFLLLLCPLAVYLIFRLGFSDWRSYGMALANLREAANYLYFLQALFDQTGILLVMAAAGLLFLFKGDRRKFYFLTVLGLMTAGFFMADGIYVGFARWNLFLLPIAFAAGLELIKRSSKAMRLVFLVSLLSANVLLSPMHLDGARRPSWAAGLTGDGEQVYPYEQTVKWLSRQEHLNTLLILGRDYYYDGMEFYLNKYGFRPRMLEINFPFQDRGQEKEAFRFFFYKYDQLKDYAEKNAVDQRSRRLLSQDAVLYHSVHDLDIAAAHLYSETFRPAKRFCNSEHCLYVFLKKRNAE